MLQYRLLREGAVKHCDEFVCVHQISGLCLYECPDCNVSPCEVCVHRMKCSKAGKR